MRKKGIFRFIFNCLAFIFFFSWMAIGFYELALDFTSHPFVVFFIMLASVILGLGAIIALVYGLVRLTGFDRLVKEYEKFEEWRKQNELRPISEMNEEEKKKFRAVYAKVGGHKIPLN